MVGKRIAITGSTGLVGKRLLPVLESAHFEVVRLARHASTGPDEIYWNPSTGEIDAAALEGIDAVIHLAGSSIAGKRWSETRKREIRDSRIAGTTLLAETLARNTHRPAVFVSTSAVGYYGNGGSALLTEDAAKGEGFLADVCDAWEAAAEPAAAAGIRVVHPRFGIVLANEGGFLPQLARLFRLGLGGRIAAGDQYMSWIDIDDLTRLLLKVVEDPRIEGPVNAVSPTPITNSTFTKALAGTLHRPAILPVPSIAIKLTMGEMGQELVLVSQRAVPARLDDVGFEFRYPSIDTSLDHQLRLQSSVHTSRQQVATKIA